MALVLVEVEEQLPGLVGTLVSATGSQAPGASKTATKTSSACTFRTHGIYAVAVALSIGFIF